jgi:dTDP-4-amino-4,6-dideoxygalactose transaminase
MNPKSNCQTVFELKMKKSSYQRYQLMKRSNPITFSLVCYSNSNRIDLQDYLHQNGIQTVIHYQFRLTIKRLCHFEPFVFPITQKIHDEVLSLPISPVLTMEEVSYIVSVLNKY